MVKANRGGLGEMRLYIGIILFIAGIALWHRSERTPGRGPRWLGRLGLGGGALGISTLAMTQSGLAWTITSICFSLVAITLLAWVILDVIRR